jgi:hypothetical protein
MFDFILRIWPETPSLRIQKLGLLDIFHLVPWNRFEKKPSWKAGFSIQDGAFVTEGAIGGAWAPSNEEDLTFYALLGGHGDILPWAVRGDLGPEFGFVGRGLGKNHTLQGEWNPYFYPSWKPRFSVRYSCSLDQRTRIHGEYGETNHKKYYFVRLSIYL